MATERFNANKRCLNEIDLSKKLSWLLRHGALKEGLKIQADGFVSVASILQHPKYKPHYTETVLERLVSNDKKQRYMLRRNPQTNSYEIRANQGHSIRDVDSAQCLELIDSADSIPMAVHGTYMKNWASIKKEGLRRMTRNHVHFATFEKPQAQPQPTVSNQINENNNEISGFRSNCEILIYLNITKILQEDRMKLYRSSNGVVLCAGIDEAGTIPKEYFAKVVERRSGKLLDF